ncbi:hypothetical protein NMG60_11033085 [Bertholletia excelsa]
MGELAIAVVTFLLSAACLSSGLGLPSTAPAFLWSSREDGMKAAINYQTLSEKDLANSVLSEGGWSNVVCLGEEAQHTADLAFLIVGRELKSLDISGARQTDSSLLDFLKLSFTRANFSMAFPYVAALKEEESLEMSLISEFSESCGQSFGAKNIAVLESCSLDRGKKFADVDTIHDYLVSRMEKRMKGQPNLFVLCEGHSYSERLIFSELISSMEESGARYTVLYVSDPFRLMQHPSRWEIERFLAENASKIDSAKSTICDGVCQIKSSLLEGVLVVSHSIW